MGRIGGRGFGGHRGGIGHRGGFGHGIHGRGFGHGIHGRGFGRGGRGRGGGPSIEQQIDMMEMSTNPVPQVQAGVYSYTGNQITFLSQMSNFMNIDQQNMPANGGNPINQADVTLVGSKTKTGSKLCLMLTVMCFCLIFPLCFICCQWWQKFTNATYEVSVDSYRALANMINFNTNVTNLNLKVADSAFNLEKANILAEILRNSRISGFTFENFVMKVNYQENESDDFVSNMAQIKEFPYMTSISWGGDIF